MRLVANITGDTPAQVVAFDYVENDPMYVIRGYSTRTHPAYMGPVQQELQIVFATDDVEDDTNDRGGIPLEALMEVLLDRFTDEEIAAFLPGDYTPPE